MNEIIQYETDTRTKIATLFEQYKSQKISKTTMETQINALIKEFNNKLKRTTGLILFDQVIIYSNDIGLMDAILQRKDASKWASTEIELWKNTPLDQLNFDTLLKEIQKRGCLPTKTVTIVRACIKPFILIPMLLPYGLFRILANDNDDD